jgi:hypothetical protein
LNPLFLDSLMPFGSVTEGRMMSGRLTAMVAVSAALAIAGCDGSSKESDTAVPTATPQAIPTPAPTGEAPAVDSGDAMTIDDSAQGAANVIRHYYADLDRGDFRSAYARWGHDGQDSHQSFAAFKRGFAETATTSVAVGAPGDGEGGAGSIYIEVPVTVHARLKDGTAQTFTGHYSLRRVNDVPGSTQAQRRWHIYSAELTKG